MLGFLMKMLLMSGPVLLYPTYTPPRSNGGRNNNLFVDQTRDKAHLLIHDLD